MYEHIKQIIKIKNNNIDENSLYWFSNYFYVALQKKVITEEELETIIEKTLTYSKIVFYDEDHWISKKYGRDIKGLRDSDTNTIYIRNDLPEPLREITIYHEIHHAAQTNKLNDKVGINYELSLARLIMEAQTQWFAEEVYKAIHNVSFEEKKIPSEELRMQSDGTVVSTLHNYEMYDCMLSKLAIILDTSKEFFVRINYLGENGFKILQDKYNEIYEKKKLSIKFEDLILMLDYIYCTDLLGYIDNPDKENILNGLTTTSLYEIHKGVGMAISLNVQRKYIDKIDGNLVVDLMQNGYEYKDFAKYVISNNSRSILNDSSLNQ